MTVPPVWRVAVCLSGGVDSAVTALLLKRCVHTWADLQAMTAWPSAPPLPLIEIERAVASGAPWSSVVAGGQAEAGPAVSYYPLYMKNWEDTTAHEGWCEISRRDCDDAQAIAHELGLLETTKPLPVVNLSSSFAAECFEPMLEAYRQGRTLNIDVLCNSKIKFGRLMEAVCLDPPTRKADALATGHYARVIAAPPLSLLARPLTAGKDLNDQTVFLSQVADLSRAIFPLGHVFTRKEDVRTLARRCQVAAIRRTAEKTTSTGMCFVGAAARRPPAAVPGSGRAASAPSCTLSFAGFLNDYIPPPHRSPCSNDGRCMETRILDMDAGGAPLLADGFVWDAQAARIRDEYGGCFASFCFTPGQRLRYRPPGLTPAVIKNYYVLCKILSSDLRCIDELHVVEGSDNPSLSTWVVHADQVRLHVSSARLAHLAAASPSVCEYRKNDGTVSVVCLCSVRHQHPPQRARVSWRTEQEEEGEGKTGDRSAGLEVCVEFEAPVRAVTPGQALVAYLPLRLLHPTQSFPDSEGVTDYFVLLSGWIR